MGPSSIRLRRTGGLWGGLSLLVLGFALAAPGQQPSKVSVLRIGTSGTLALDAEAGKEEAALDTLKSFIKSETGFTNEIVKQKDWRELADQLAAGEVHIGAFQGYEFAWASASHPRFRPLALAVNV